MLRPEAIAELKRALACARDLEIGGLLLENGAGVQRLQLAPNLSREAGVFETPLWWLEARLCNNLANGYRTIAFVHSHGGSILPSERDLESMKDFTLPWIIVCREAGELVWAVYEN